MKKKKQNESNEILQTINEPVLICNSNRIHIFNSFEEEEDFVAKERAGLSYDDRMRNIEILRKQIFHDYLLPDGTWKPIKQIVRILTPHTHEIS